jgi:hypothetical protein
MSICGTGADEPISPTCNTYESAGAVLEWVVAFMLVLYFLSFIADLWPVAEEVLPVGHTGNGTRQMEQGTRTGPGLVPTTGRNGAGSYAGTVGSRPAPPVVSSTSIQTLNGNGTTAIHEEPYEDIPTNDPYKLQSTH